MGRRCIHLIYLDIDTGFYPGAHHGLASLVAAVRAAGHEARLTHVRRPVSEDDFAAEMADSAADAFGFSAMSNQFKHVRRLAPVVAAATGKPVLVGGVHATLAPEETAAVEGVSCLCRGEGEIFLPKWLDALAAGGDGRDVAGCCYADGGRFAGSFAEYATDLDALAAPCYDDFDMHRILHDLGGRLSVVVSRGCPYRCTFCCNEALRKLYPTASDYVRYRSPEGAAALVAALAERFSASSVRFEDDLLLLNAAWWKAFLAVYGRRVGLPFECNSRADTVTEELAGELAAAGCVSVDIGIESGCERLRNEVLGKRVTDEQIVRAFACLHAAGLKTYAYNIVGLPTETESQAWQTYELNRHVAPSAGAVFYFYPYPGTALRAMAETDGLLRDDVDTVGGYTERPSITERDVSYAALRRVFRRLRAYLYVRRFKNFFPLPGAVKAPLGVLLAVAFRLCPPLVDLLLTESRLKRWLRRMAFRV